MEYHEIGEKFEHNGVVLEVVEGTGLWTEDCVNCEVKKSENCHIFHHCSRKYRADKKDVYYKLVEQCKPKENNNMKKQIYYADLTPCDNMDDYNDVKRTYDLLNSLIGARHKYKTDVSNALCLSIRTEKRCSEDFPEALPYLNFSGTTAVARKFDDLRAVLHQNM